MPMGKGTYGTKVGRPPKKKKAIKILQNPLWFTTQNYTQILSNRRNPV